MALTGPSPALRKASRAADSDDDEYDSDGGDVGTVNARSGGIRTGGSGLGTGAVAGRRRVDSDEDSDFDL
jgi:hypothetical protein